MGAIAMFNESLKLDDNLKLDPKTYANIVAAPSFVRQGEGLAKEGKIKEAIAAYEKTQQIDPTLKISADSWNELCWFGSLHGHAADVMNACEKAVGLEPMNGGFRDSRGVARVLTGNTAGAIEDFQALKKWTENAEVKSRRQRWSDALRAGKNPFTAAEIESLLEQVISIHQFR